MASQPIKPHAITFPFTPRTAEDIDFNFDVLFRQVAINERGGVLPVRVGGTGINSYETGDILYADSPITLSGLHNVVPGHAVISSGVHHPPEYGKIALSGAAPHVEGVLPPDHGGTGLDSFVTGDLLTASGTTSLVRLAGVAAGNVLISGGVGGALVWGKAGLSTHVSGVLPMGSGGTGETTASEAFDALSPLAAKGDLLTRDAATNLRLAVGTDDQVLVADSSAPSGLAWLGPIGSMALQDAGAVSITGGAIDVDALTVSTAGVPRFYLHDEDGGPNQKVWNILCDDAVFALQAVTDNLAVETPIWVLTRAGTTPTHMQVVPPLTSFGLVSARGATAGVPVSGSGIEMGWDGAFGFVQAFNRTSSTYQPLSVRGNAVQISVNGTVVTQWADPRLFHLGGLQFPGVQSVTTSIGNNNNVLINPETVLLRVTTSGGATNTVTGLTGAAGRLLVVAHVAGVDALEFADDSAASSASNRMLLANGGSPVTVRVAGMLHDGVTSRWRRLFGV